MIKESKIWGKEGIYRSYKFGKLPSWVGIGPDNWLLLSWLIFYLSFFFFFQKFMKIVYRNFKLVKFLNWIGMIPESWLEESALFNLDLGFSWEVENKNEIKMVIIQIL